MDKHLKLNHLSYRYMNSNIDAIQDITFEVNAGERIALVGGNGAGKSTLLMQINGLLMGSGEIHVNGYKLDRSSLKEIRKIVGFVFQDPDDQLFMPTVEEDVRFGLMYQDLDEHDIIAKTEAVFKDLGIEDLRFRAPYHLSGGEKRLVALATVLVLEPSILIFDEPTAGLDPKARRNLINLLANRPEIQIIATHDLEFAVETTDRTLVMLRGKLVADGKTDDILANYDLMQSCDLEVPHILHHGEHRH